jgi:hypothetical protein
VAYNFGDSFDLYATTADAISGYWDSASVTSNMTLQVGRFTGSQCARWTAITNSTLIKTSGVNDAVHHFALAFMQTATITGSTLGLYIELFDGATAQCSIVFRSDGAILLISGAPNSGTTLATYTGAFPAINTWYAFEFEVVINNTTGSFKVRKNGNTSDDSSTTGIDTQNSANAYANKIQIAENATISSQNLDDLYWQSGSSAGTWLGDIRCYTRMPTSDASVQFSRTPTGALTQTSTGGSSATGFFNNVSNAVYTAFVAGYSGTVTGTSVAVVSLGGAANMKCAIHADNGSGSPGTILASATSVITPVVGTNAFTFSPGVTVTKGVQYWIGAITDTTTGFGTGYATTSTTGLLSMAAMAYSAFPQANPILTATRSVQMSWTYTATPANWQAVSELQEDGGTSYVYDNVINDSDLYTIAALPSVPTSTVAVTTRAFVQKADAGSRTGSVQLKSGSTVVQSPNPSLVANTWTWLYRTDTVDPNTTLAWTAANVALAQIGPIIVT